MRILLLLLVLLGSYLPGLGFAATVSESPVQWQPMTLDVLGPTISETDDNPNPFLDIRLDITLTGPSGVIYNVPGFFDGDGNGNGSGNIWRIRFTPDEPGQWQYLVHFQQGTDLAVAQFGTTGNALGAHGASGEFSVDPVDPQASGFYRNGRLEYVGEHYLKLANGSYWIKGGVDSPENFLGYAGFDNTVNQPGGVGEGTLANGLHHYATHIADWQPGDPNFISADTGEDGKGIIGAINYLSSQAVNSMYFLPMNLGGDGRDSYPFIGASGSDYDNTHYDISKLSQWNIVFDHMQRKSIAAHWVLAEQETGNTHWLDNGELGVQRKLFYRELIARFSYLNALKWNLSEESQYGTLRHREFARAIRKLDWAAHPVAVHNWLDNPDLLYNDLLGNPDFDVTSIQFNASNADRFVETWRQKSADAGWPWVIDMDEVAPGNIGLTDSNSDELRKSVLYPVYFSGGNVEWYFGYQASDVRTEDFRTREAMYRYMRIARQFMLDELPFWQMTPNDDALSGGNDNDQVFEKPGVVYALYLPTAQTGRSLQVAEGNYTLTWFNPRIGKSVGEPRGVSGTAIDIGTAPESESNFSSEDWVVLIKTTDSNDIEPDLSAATPAPDENVNLPQVEPQSCTSLTENTRATISAYVQDGTLIGGNLLRVEHGQRKAYLQFDSASIFGDIDSVVLQFNVDADSGSGNLRVFSAQHNDWSLNSDVATLPMADREVGSRNGLWERGQRYRIELDLGASAGTTHTLVIELDSDSEDFSIRVGSAIDKPILLVYSSSDCEDSMSSAAAQEIIAGTPQTEIDSLEVIAPAIVAANGETEIASENSVAVEQQMATGIGTDYGTGAGASGQVLLFLLMTAMMRIAGIKRDSRLQLR